MKLGRITVNVFNVSHTDSDNYITSIEMPDYKSLKRTKRWLAHYVRQQSGHDMNQKKCRFYVFQSNQFVLKELDLNNINK